MKTQAELDVLPERLREGWFMPFGSAAEHYFRNGFSLCGHFMKHGLLFRDRPRVGALSPARCATCRRALALVRRGGTLAVCAICGAPKTGTRRNHPTCHRAPCIRRHTEQTRRAHAD